MKTPDALTQFSALTNYRAKAVIGTFRGRLGGNNRRDDYTLTVSRRSSFSVALTGLRSNADLQLRQSNGRLIARSNRPGSRPERIRRILEPGTYTVRVLRREGNTRYRLTIADQSNSSLPNNSIINSPNHSTVPTNPFQSLWGEYRGVGVTTIGKIDPLSGQLYSTNSFQTTIIANVSQPATAGGITESNPFNLFVGSSPSEIAQNVEGAISIHSAIPFTFRGGFLVQYWQLQYQGNQISGTLTNPNTAIAAATNLFNSTKDLGLGLTIPFPYAMDAGTTLQGTLSANELRIQIQGLDTGRTRVFVSDIVAQRV
ncbi:PPC domain-containing protein [Egbenema bharatensis]|uniref:PPC domain-containing protein n=1 Tax=Egbenema bharatensis TaxID=3463334 RepID=UPI003A842698